MTILEPFFWLIAAFCLGFIICWIYLVAPSEQELSRLIGKVAQEKYYAWRWQQAYEKANNDFMKLAETHNNVTKGELNDC